MSRQQIGIIGLAVMGKNLALNIESKGYSLSVYERIHSETDKVLAENRGKRLVGTYSLKEFAASLETPRKIIMMIKAGQPVDDTIALLKPYLQKGDIIVDGGNSFFEDTIRRNRELEKEEIFFIGSGTSGGEDGALHGPALMPGGQKEAYEQMEPVLTAISAKVDGTPCCTYIGKDGAGHFVKMVHNGIEYGDMQLICEAFSILKDIGGLSYEEMSDEFGAWNKGELDSYLIEITRDILRKKDAETSLPLLDLILDAAGQKGTGKWASKSALDEGVSTQTITEAVFARCLSAVKEERMAASKLLHGPAIPPFTGDRRAFVEDVRRALYASKICSYAQGFALLRSAAAEYRWDLNYGNIAMIFRGGCIIRARFLQKIKDAYDREPALANLLLDPYFGGILQKYQNSWRQVIAKAVTCGVPVPAFSSALAYFDGYRSERLPANLLQAQRDYFGAHTYERVDKPRGRFFHTDWTGHGGTTSATTYTV